MTKFFYDFFSIWQKICIFVVPNMSKFAFPTHVVNKSTCAWVGFTICKIVKSFLFQKSKFIDHRAHLVGQLVKQYLELFQKFGAILLAYRF